MAEKKVTMVMKVDLQCYRCYKKIKKVLCKFPEIRDQLYDEKQKRVIIAVVSCCPERILEKIARKGGKTVESIEIVVPEKKKEGDKPKDGEKKEGDKPKDGGEKKEGGGGKAGGEKKKEGGGGGGDKPGGEKKKEGGGGGDKPKEGDKKEAQVHKHIAEPIPGYPMIHPSGMYYQLPQPYHQGYGVVPYYHGVPAYHSEAGYGVNRGYNTNHCYYFSEESPENCTVM